MNCKYYNEEFIRIKKDVDKLYDIHPAGGSLHIVVDDDNLEDENIQWCIDNADPLDEDYEISMKIAHAMLKMSMKERMLFTIRDRKHWPCCKVINETGIPNDCQNCFVEHETFEYEVNDDGTIIW